MGVIDAYRNLRSKAWRALRRQKSSIRRWIDKLLAPFGLEVIPARARVQTRRAGLVTLQMPGQEGTYSIACASPWESVFPDLDPANGRALFRRSLFNPGWLEDLQVEPDVILDIGAYDAGDAIRFKARFPNARVATFEADPRLYANICNYAGQYGIEAVHGAVCDHDGTASFFLADEVVRNDESRAGAQGSLRKHTASYKSQYGHIRQSRTPTEVPAITVETWCKTNAVSSIHLVHIDVEGAEIDVIRGLGSLRPELIFLETAMAAGWEGTNRNELYGLLKSMGYKLVLALPTDRLYVYEGE